jgi:regulator of RNase E activity RraB
LLDLTRRELVFRRKRSVSIAGDSWAVYFYYYGEGQKAVISFDVELAKEENHTGYGHSIRVIVYVPLTGRVLENGMPVREELPKLQQLEDNLLQALQKRGVDCRLVGRMTYGGMRELVFQVEDVKAFRRSFSRVATDDYKVELREGDDWQFFDEKIRPTPVFWQQITDQMVIQGLIKAGSNPKAPHFIEHSINGERQKLIRLRDELTANGFTEVGMGDDHLTVGKESKLDIDEIFSVTGKLSSYCESIGVKYDGWGAAVIK